MSTANPTPFAGLNQWQLEDEIKMDEFNTDNTKIDLALSEISNMLSQPSVACSVYTANAVYSEGIFQLFGLPKELPGVFSVRFIAPQAYTLGDMLQVNDRMLSFSTTTMEALSTWAFAEGALVLVNIDLAASRAYYGYGQLERQYVLGHSILPPQSKITVTPRYASAEISLSNEGGYFFEGTRLVFKEGTAMPRDLEDGEMIDVGKGTEYTLMDLTNDQPYTIRAFAYSPESRIQTDIIGAVDTFTPMSGIALSKLLTTKLPPVIRIPEKDGVMDFLLLQHGYNTGLSLLLRKDLLANSAWHSINSTLYSGSSVDIFLNETYFKSLPKETQSKTANTTISSGSSISRKVFALSSKEIGNTGSEGTHIPHFSVNSNRIAHRDSVVTAYWTRSVSNSTNYQMYYINADGALGSAVRSTSYATRPAFCIASDAKVHAIPNSDGSFNLIV